MRTVITIELEGEETLAEAMAKLAGNPGARTCATASAEPQAKAAPDVEPDTEAEAEKPAPKPKAKAKKSAAARKAAEEKTAPDKIDFEQLRDLARQKIDEGKREGLEAILEEYGGRLTQVPEDAQADVLAQIEAL